MDRNNSTTPEREKGQHLPLHDGILYHYNYKYIHFQSS